MWGPGQALFAALLLFVMFVSAAHKETPTKNKTR
jgi:hypothetical protein